VSLCSDLQKPQTELLSWEATGILFRKADAAAHTHTCKDTQTHSHTKNFLTFVELKRCLVARIFTARHNKFRRKHQKQHAVGYVEGRVKLAD